LRPKTNCTKVLFIFSHAYRLGLRPTIPNHPVWRTLSRHTVSHLSSSVKPSSFKNQETGDSSRTNPPLACNTQQYAAQITLIQNTNMHLGAITCPCRFPPPRHRHRVHGTPDDTAVIVADVHIPLRLGATHDQRWCRCGRFTPPSNPRKSSQPRVDGVQHLYA
jgi:hypothetical protein